MSGSLNKILIIGNLGRDPEIRSTSDGTKIANLSVATSESWKDRSSGERREKTEWHRVVIFDEKLTEVAERYLKKGSKVYLEGQLQTRKWTDQQGQDRYSTEVVLQRFRGVLTMLDSPKSDGGQQAAQLSIDEERRLAVNAPPSSSQGTRGMVPPEPVGGDDPDDLVPF